MMDKKALGLHWYIAALAFIISMGILAWGNINTKMPLVGQFSASIANAMENGNNIPLEVESIMNQLNIEASLSYENHGVFKLVSFCNETKFDLDGDSFVGDVSRVDDTRFKQRWFATNPITIPSITPTITPGESQLFTTRTPDVKCFAKETTNEELLRYYEEKFNLEYKHFKETPSIWQGSGLDFSGILYTSTMKKENNKYYNEIKTENNFEQKIMMEKDRKEEEIGKFWLSPDYKLETPNPLMHPFDTEEVCIF
ncbi:MAG: hypothetical protein AABX34_05510, partial [Nanoarchaeota archaeon]